MLLLEIVFTVYLSLLLAQHSYHAQYQSTAFAGSMSAFVHDPSKRWCVRACARVLVHAHVGQFSRSGYAAVHFRSFAP